MIKITVSNVAGDSIDLELQSDVTPLAAKDHIDTQWSIPQKYQQLVHDTTVLEDADSLASRCADDGKALRLTMVVSVDAVAKELRGASFQRQLVLLKHLTTAGAHGVGTPVDFLCNFIEDDAARLAAGRTLGLIAKGDARAVQLVAQHLKHDDELVREAAAEALMEVGAPGDAAAVALLADRAAEEESPKVRRAILLALSKVAARGDATAMAVAYTCLGDSVVDVRWAAARAVAPLAEAGDAEAVRRLGACFADEQWIVRHAAAEALADVAARDDPEVKALLSGQLQGEEDYQVKKAIQQTLAKLAGQEPPSQVPTWNGGLFAVFAHNYGAQTQYQGSSQPDDWD
mmetsp:Transcript_25664/g.51805  ORF Transcript_25664/g.51805 Transcript_25664/m.51805 type:complete len:345 (-) Transcript_25664:224-1258(-)